MTVTRFPIVSRTASKIGWCPVCNKQVERRRRFEQTVNPWNRNDIGAPKTYEEVQQDVLREAGEWVPDFTHRLCVGSTPEGQKDA